MKHVITYEQVCVYIVGTNNLYRHHHSTINLFFEQFYHWNYQIDCVDAETSDLKVSTAT